MSDPTTATARPQRPQGLAAVSYRRVHDLLAQLPEGPLQLVLPDGDALVLGPPGEPAATLRVHRWELFRRLALAGDVGFGEGYMAGDWDSDDIARLLRLCIRAGERLATVARGSALWRLARRWHHRRHTTTRAGSRRNIAAHYDLSNDFYRLWLDDTMTYSCALFAHPDQPLAEAQRRKLERIAALASLRPGMRVLEIGCGWGSFLELAAARGCSALGITLSKEQAEYARARLATVSGAIRVEETDYRDVTGTFDAVVSIEMLEAVGHARLPAFFATVDRVLARGGSAVIQSITIPDHRYAAYRANPDFIQTHIFPGGHLPCLAAIAEAVARTRLVIESVENIGPHYATTLRRWRQAFLARREQVKALGFDEPFLRRWEYYLAYCEAGFAEALINDHIIVLRRAGEPAHPGVTS